MMEKQSSCRLIVAVATILLLLPAPSADAVIVYLKDQDEPLRGYLVENSPERVVIQELLDDGRLIRRELVRSLVEDVIVSVEPERLAALDPKEPRQYRNYAEELAEKRIDPEAQETAIRLYLIAAHRQAELARSSLLGMIDLARNDAEQRRFRALLYLIDNDASQLVDRSPRAAGERITDEARHAARRALKLLRQGHKREAHEWGERADLRSNLPRMTNAISYDEFLDACALVCTHCRRGKQACRQCDGAGSVQRDGVAYTCSYCRGRKNIDCEVCHGDYRRGGISQDLLRRVLELELSLLGASPVDDPAAAEPDQGPSWSESLSDQPRDAQRALDLVTVTEFDPHQCVFRSGRWTKDEGRMSNDE